MAIFSDNFDSYTTPIVFPIGPWTFRDNILTTIVSPGLRSVNAAQRGWGRVDGTYYASISNYMAVLPSPGTILSVGVAASGASSILSLLSLQICPDLTSILISGGAMVAGSLSQVLEPGWNFIQLTVSCGRWTDLGVDKVQLDVGYALNGITVFSGTVNTNITVASLNALNFWAPFTTDGINSWVFASTERFDDVTVNSGIDALPSYPNEDTGRKAQISQMVIEVGKQRSDSEARVSQMVIEVAKLPSDSHAVVSQMVIELMVRQLPNKWYVSES